MELKIVEDIKEWFNLTDLDEIQFRDGDFRISLAKKGANLEDVKINSNLTPVFAQDVGVFCFSKKGKSISLKKGDSVKKGSVLGYIDVGKRTVEVKSPCDGIVRMISVEDGMVVEYSQLLFVIE